MSATSDIRAYSKRLMLILQALDILLDRVPAADDLTAVSSQCEAVLEDLTVLRSDLRATIGDGPTATLRGAAVRHSISLTMGELPLEAAIQALGEIPQLLDKVRTQGSGTSVLSVPLVLAYRHCVESLMPLAAAVDPRELA